MGIRTTAIGTTAVRKIASGAGTHSHTFFMIL